MNFFQTRRQIVLGLAFLVLIVALFYGALNKPKMGTGEPTDLITQREIELDDNLRFLYDFRVETFKSALAAQEHFEELTGQRKDWDLYIEIASNANMIGDLETARYYYEEMLKLNPLHYTVWNNLGNVQYRQGDYEAALSSYAQVIELYPSEEGYRDYIRVLALEETGDRDEEIKEALEEGVSRVGQTSWFMVQLAEWYWQHDECDQAYAHYEVAMDIAPDLEAIEKDYNEAKQTCGKTE